MGTLKNTGLAAGVILLFCLPVLGSVASLWLTGSVITSGIKTLSNDCGQRYPVEVVFGGNWFCPETSND